VSPRPLAVLVIDDSALIRNLVTRILESAPGITVCGTALNGKFALPKIERLQPDCIVLDIEMPEMNGVEFLAERRKRRIGVPVIVLSSVVTKGAEITMEALNLGASDFILKPSGTVSADVQSVGTQLIAQVRAYGGEYRRTRGQTADLPETGPGAGQLSATDAPPITSEPIIPEAAPGTLELIAIGVSTGGPNALRKILADIDCEIALPIVIVQHMPAGFTAEFAKSLDRICRLEVREAVDGDVLKPGRVLIAPGNYHTLVERRRLANVVRVADGPPCNGHRPSVDVLFQSVAQAFGNHAMAVIMTGMGKDGAAQIGEIYRRGGLTIAQDMRSSVVYGMPKAAQDHGFIRHQFGLDEMAAQLSRLAEEYR